MPDLSWKDLNGDALPATANAGNVVEGGTVTLPVQLENTSGDLLEAVTITAETLADGIAFSLGNGSNDYGASLSLGDLADGATAEVWLRITADVATPAGVAAFVIVADYVKSVSPGTEMQEGAGTVLAIPADMNPTGSRAVKMAVRRAAEADEVRDATGGGLSVHIQERWGYWGRIREKPRTLQLSEEEVRRTVGIKLVILPPNAQAAPRDSLVDLSTGETYEVLNARPYPNSVQCDVRKVS